jgi:hypothetical protein
MRKQHRINEEESNVGNLKTQSHQDGSVFFVTDNPAISN